MHPPRPSSAHGVPYAWSVAVVGSMLAALLSLWCAEDRYLDLLPLAPDAGAGPPKPRGTVCIIDGDCAGPKPQCDIVQGICVECVTSTACTKGNKLVCDTASQVCVECLRHEDCSPERPRCDRVRLQCVECETKADCADPTRACHPATHRCVPTCSTASTCSGPTPRCSAELEICVECATAQDCTDAKKPTCAVSEGRCVACVADAQCKPNETCDTSTWQCRPAPGG